MISTGVNKVTDEKKPESKIPAKVTLAKPAARPPAPKGPSGPGGRPQAGFGGGKAMMRKAGRGR
ncbi:hypothetical protein B0G85_0677 [Polynucleobacter brandtiae]|uniref:Uncharacterized protein n=1 Tax=Polynucleobacter brandtiae TaxID=1938816 RepID=A0A2M8VZJ9_9BURK|nr:MULTISPECIES: hypothetical protein [Polynucleobacter]PJI83281.1 hypothetical protein B0G85_0677 [Polynucleobacter brandtiae]